jgi:predicted enzyme related to lactoylglutathione lyase
MQMTRTRLTTAPVTAVIPATDIDRARQFYHVVLGFDVKDYPGGMFMAEAGKGTTLLVYQTDAKSSATVAGFQVDDLEGTLAELRDHGVTIQEFDMPGLKTVNGIADFGEAGRSAWFLDSEGNSVSIAEM